MADHQSDLRTAVYDLEKRFADQLLELWELDQAVIEARQALSRAELDADRVRRALRAAWLWLKDHAYTPESWDKDDVPTIILLDPDADPFETSPDAAD